MKRKLDLRTGRPVWFAYRAPAVPTHKLTRDVKTDVAVVGMGISGAMMAEALTARGLSVVCIDRRGPMKGSTPATTALVQFEIDQPLTKLVRHDRPREGGARLAALAAGRRQPCRAHRGTRHRLRHGRGGRRSIWPAMCSARGELARGGGSARGRQASARPI